MVTVDGENKVFGLIEGYDDERNELILKRIDSNIEIKPGQKVMSSGLGGIFPEGLYIGEITEVTTDDFGLTKMAYIKPAADFALLDHVMVAKRSMPSASGIDGEVIVEEEEEKEEDSS